MVQKVVPYEVCDIHLPDEVNADKTISFTYGLVGYELDVCARHGDDVAKKLAKVDEILGALAGSMYSKLIAEYVKTEAKSLKQHCEMLAAKTA